MVWSRDSMLLTTWWYDSSMTISNIVAMHQMAREEQPGAHSSSTSENRSLGFPGRGSQER